MMSMSFESNGLKGAHILTMAHLKVRSLHKSQGGLLNSQRRAGQKSGKGQLKVKRDPLECRGPLKCGGPIYCGVSRENGGGSHLSAVDHSRAGSPLKCGEPL